MSWLELIVLNKVALGALNKLDWAYIHKNEQELLGIYTTSSFKQIWPKMQVPERESIIITTGIPTTNL